MTQHYIDNDGNVYGFAPKGVEVTPITVEEARAAVAAASPAKTQEDINKELAAAYAHPITGSDKLFMEFQRKLAEGDQTGADAYKAAWLARVAEIKASI